MGTEKRGIPKEVKRASEKLEDKETGGFELPKLNQYEEEYKNDPEGTKEKIVKEFLIALGEKEEITKDELHEVTTEVQGTIETAMDSLNYVEEVNKKTKERIADTIRRAVEGTKEGKAA